MFALLPTTTTTTPLPYRTVDAKSRRRGLNLLASQSPFDSQSAGMLLLLLLMLLLLGRRGGPRGAVLFFFENAEKRSWGWAGRGLFEPATIFGAAATAVMVLSPVLWLPNPLVDQTCWVFKPVEPQTARVIKKQRF